MTTRNPGTVVVVAKVPNASGGKSKTRLIPLLGDDHSRTANLARAMMTDVLSTIDEVGSQAPRCRRVNRMETQGAHPNESRIRACDEIRGAFVKHSPRCFSFRPHSLCATFRNAFAFVAGQIQECHKVVLYAPPTPEARNELCYLLDCLAEDRSRQNGTDVATGTNDALQEEARSTSSPCGWTLLEMEQATLQDTDLSRALTAASLTIVSELFPDTSSLVFVGTDAPELRLEDLRDGLNMASGKALLCPAQDGGYGLLGVSVSNSNRHMLDALFRGVLWSHPLTALSQLRAAQLAGYGPVRLGPIMRDVDLPEDVTNLCQRLAGRPSSMTTCEASPGAFVAEDSEFGCLQAPTLGASGTSSSSGATAAPGRCRYTRQALQDLGLLP
jgi:glycosyltransferase A (GT-A) superfamily protein (DUF2064 family)